MKREYLLMHLEAHECNIIVPKQRSKKFVIARHKVTGKQHAIADDEYIKPTRVCYICRWLGVEVPQVVQGPLGLIDEVGKIHGLDFDSSSTQ